ncbi:glycosyl hydrolase [bacterium DOLZORAL124_64_63]|nr:MAG: glycosyl hydrolase [bacterium DOLZORAL124_64_63]
MFSTVLSPDRFLRAVLVVLCLLAIPPVHAKDDAPWNSGDFSGLQWRGIGPAIASGRVGDFAVDPRDKSHYYVAVCSGNVWETHNAGVTFKPIFDGEGSYSIGCMAISPSHPDQVWVGSGESNSQRSVSYGDGIYKSVDGGRSWRNMGLERSLHIGRIIVHPTNPDIVWVAAMGPLWGPGGDRGVFKTTDGGETWNPVLTIDENTGICDLVADPRDPDVLYAASYQRRRHTWTLINGGPGSGIHKTTDGGQSWTELTSGLPGVDMGRIGLAVARKQPDTVYAIIEAAEGQGGFFRSDNGGASWSKQSGYVAGSPQYYNEIVPDPVNPERLYSMDTFLQVTEDGGRNWRELSFRSKHVDDHALWIDPDNTDHLLAGCDGGVYESFDRGENWRFFPNLPITQFYRVAIDNDLPYYNVYGGTQDNNTIGGPSRTTFAHGASNREWFFTLGGDGFKPAVDPANPNIVYSQWQYGNLHRYDKVSGEILDIQPTPEQGEILKWNWNSPLLISPHKNTRLYYACQKVFVSEDRGHSWTKISEDLSRGEDRNRKEIMGRVWGVDTVAKNSSTSFYGTIISFNESPVTEGLLFAGTDDGQISVKQPGNPVWKTYNRFSGVPDESYVSDIEPSRFDDQVVFASFDNHKRDDFKPYLLMSKDQGRSWKSIAGDLPERGTIYTIGQDGVDPDLLFVGTEFGVFFTRNGGRNWVQLSAGMPTIACRDLEIQRRENDLVVATFGRGIYILDDYSPLRNLEPATLEKDAVLFPVKPALIYHPGTPIGSSGKGHQGDSFYLAPNPPYGAIITYYLPQGLQTLEGQRRKADKEKFQNDEPVFYPTWDELRAEDREIDPAIILTIRDAQDHVVRRFTGPDGKGFHRVAWDLRYPDTGPVELNRGEPSTPWEDIPAGPYAMPGSYSVTLAKRVRGTETTLAGPVNFRTKLLGNNALQTDDFGASLAFQQEAAELSRAVQGAARTIRDAESRLDHIRQAINDTPALDRSLLAEVDRLQNALADMRVVLHGDRTISRRSEPVTPGICSRVSRVMWGTREITTAPTDTQRRSLAIAAGQFGPLLEELRQLVEQDLAALESTLEKAGAPYTPGRIPVWRK